MTTRSLVSSLVLCGLVVFGGTSARATEVTDAAAPFSALGTLRIQVIIRPFLRLRVGTASTAVGLLQFAPTAAVVGDSTPIVGSGGDAGGSTVNVLVQGNRNQITVTPTNSSGGLGIGTGVATDGRINYNQIGTTSSDAANFPAPVLANAGGAAVLPVMNAPGITNRAATWAYRYLNQTIPSAGTYGGVNLNGSRVTYTATMP